MRLWILSCIEKTFLYCRSILKMLRALLWGKWRVHYKFLRFREKHAWLGSIGCCRVTHVWYSINALATIGSKIIEKTFQYIPFIGVANVSQSTFNCFCVLHDKSNCNIGSHKQNPKAYFWNEVAFRSIEFSGKFVQWYTVEQAIRIWSRSPS